MAPSRSAATPRSPRCATTGKAPGRVDYTDRTTGEAHRVLGDYVLGCDGAGSLTRATIGATMRDLR